MAKIEFTAQELEILRKAAEAYREGGVEKAKTAMEDGGLKIEISPELREDFAAPETGLDGADGCYACFSCLVFLAATVALAWSTG